jgi:hypothetical protein
MTKKITAALLSVLVLATILTSCSGIIKMKYENGSLIDSKNGIRYLKASISYEPVSTGEQYAKADGIELFTMSNADATEWLSEKFNGVGAVYYSEDVHLPTIAEFDPTRAIICSGSEKLIGLAAIDDEEVLRELCRLLDEGENAEITYIADSYPLKFISADYPFLYYNVMYTATEDGGRYLYDRGTHKTVEVGNLLEPYFEF